MLCFAKEKSRCSGCFQISKVAKGAYVYELFAVLRASSSGRLTLELASSKLVKHFLTTMLLASIYYRANENLFLP